MKTVGLIGLKNEDNVGDPILYKSSEYLLKNVIPEGYAIKLISLNGEKDNYIKKIWFDTRLNWGEYIFFQQFFYPLQKCLL